MPSLSYKLFKTFYLSELYERKPNSAVHVRRYLCVWRVAGYDSVRKKESCVMLRKHTTKRVWMVVKLIETLQNMNRNGV